MQTITLINNEPREEHQLLVVTNQEEVWYKQGTQPRVEQKMHPNFSLVLNQWMHGFVLHKGELDILFWFNFKVLLFG